VVGVNVKWQTTDKVTVEMDDVEYMHITCALMLLQIHLKKRPNLLPFLNSLHADLYAGVDGRMAVKQKERIEEKC